MSPTHAPLRLGLILALTLGIAPPLGAEVVRVEVTTRADLGRSGYEKIAGIVRFAIDPTHPRNRVIADIDRAPVTEAGRVEFSADFYILRPLDPSRSNGLALVEVPNRGRKLILGGFNRHEVIDPATDADLGDGFLLKRGFTLVWVGWEFDLERQGGLLGIDVPSARDVTAVVRGTVIPADAAERQTVADLAGYAPLDAASSANTLVVRDGPYGTPRAVDRDQWTLDGNTVTLKGGFQPGRNYELSYRAAHLPIAGLGLAAVRDLGAWIRYAPDALVRPRATLAFGSAQSGRFLRTFLYEGFNTDERGRPVFDAVWAHTAGASRISLNERGATPASMGMFTATSFPYANQATRDPISGRREGLLDNDRARLHQPKTFYTNTSVEYWGGGRAAALVHASPDGQADLDLPDNTRVYFLTGAQYAPAAFPTRVTRGQQPDNPLEFWWTMRALLVAMEQWLLSGTAPPASRYPRLSDGTLVPAERVGFPSLPGVQSPSIITGARYDSKADGAPIPFLVPQLDADGNERAGIRTAELLAPLATYTGWNFRNPAIGATDQIVQLLGSRILLPRTRAEREAARDPRPAVEERYPSREAYLARAREVAESLVGDGFLLAGDVAPVMGRMEAQWAEATGRVRP
jgi:hypothetical protein